ncbi:hypothetical protein EDB85DRAFT_1428512 [Lactarius pseudohatsudake]|nr:hypothetical protein EDB85DRAFT_1428512 [Lactarius pseudohatsudake]
MSCHYSRTAQPRAFIATLASLPLFTSSAWAAPLSSLAKRDSSGGGNKIIAPIIVVVVLVIIVPMLFYRKSLFSKLRNITFYSVLAPHQPPVTVRDLTAEEIAGTTATTQAQTAAAARTDRRARRNRRTPSQISTRSLPAYMKEPGELELVIIQGSQDMEDAPLTTQVLMPSVREDDDDESSQTHSRNISQASSYVIVNDDDSHAQTPLLETDPSNEITHENSNAHVSPGTVDISDVRESDDLSPLPNSPEFTDPRGEAPPYFEVVGDLEAVRVTSGELTRVETTDTLPMAPDTSRVSHEQSVETAMDDASATLGTRRRSMFRGLINAASRALSSPHTHPQSPTASRLSRDVPTSPRPSNMSTRPAGTRSPQVGHRTTLSNGSVLSVTSSAFGRVTSRSRSTTNVAALTSPSMISITSISAPLTHTAVRTDFVYPRSGPTPEQLKLISSVDSVSKFGVPYGPAAVAYASASRVNLQPPPDFEERPSLDGLPGTSEATTRARSRSALSRGSQEENPPDSRSHGSSPSPPPAESTPAPLPMSTPASEPAISTSSPDHDTFDDTKEPELVDPVEIALPRPPSPSPTVATTSTTATVTRATLSTLRAVAETPDDPIATSSHRPALPSFDAAAAPTARKPVAPSSFRVPSTPLGGMRAGSRTSSVETFRTAVSSPEQGQRGGDETVTSDTELETDAFTDAEGAESETPPATPHAGPVVGGIALGPEPHALIV